MAKRVACHSFRQPGCGRRLSYCLLHKRFMQMVSPLLPRRAIYPATLLRNHKLPMPVSTITVQHARAMLFHQHPGPTPLPRRPRGSIVREYPLFRESVFGIPDVGLWARRSVDRRMTASGDCESSATDQSSSPLLGAETSLPQKIDLNLRSPLPKRYSLLCYIFRVIWDGRTTPLLRFHFNEGPE